MAKKSAAALAIVPPSKLGGKPAPPKSLTKREKDLWGEVVDTKPAGWWDADSLPVLREYVRAAVTCDLLDARVRSAFRSGDDAALRGALDMRDKEARRMVSLATKMRLTQQSRYDAKTAATADQRAAGKRPWGA
jgi:hypothetical protein